MSSDQRKDPFFEIVEGFEQGLVAEDGSIPEAERLTPKAPDTLEAGLTLAIEMGVREGLNGLTIASDYCLGALTVIYDPDTDLKDRSIAFQNGHLMAQLSLKEGSSANQIKDFVEQQASLQKAPKVIDLSE